MQARKLESLYMGCVSTSSRFFEDGEITEKRMKRARLAARLELQPVRATFHDYGWDHAMGSSGTIRSVSDVLRARDGDGAITLAAVESLIEHPGRMTHASAAGSPLQVDPALVRLSVGIESTTDLVSDLAQALESV